MTDVLDVWTPAALLSAVVGGALVGLFLVSRFDNPRFNARQSVAVVLVLGSFSGLVFYVGQAVDVFVDDGATLGWRVVSRFLLFVVYIAFMAVGTGFGVSRRRGGWAADGEPRTPANGSPSLDDIAAQLRDIQRTTSAASNSAELAHTAASAADDRVISQAERAADDRERGKRIEDVSADTNERTIDIQGRLP